ncbi:hypothetical protein EMEDMD4_90020 [Sinorhizobium medicae]|uniref:Uncharacterized protein n=1 Tax=Sinorhizobium medicae TaxID=110321 RepID=A0A508X6Z2_9HYPH|nr:hypothetical protein EMEDMD4_90020 [Sinorhizobium medicae]
MTSASGGFAHPQSAPLRYRFTEPFIWQSGPLGACNHIAGGRRTAYNGCTHVSMTDFMRHAGNARFY